MGDVLERLQAHQTVGQAPREELEWLVAHGTLEHYEPGHMIAKKGQPVDALYILLSGHVAHSWIRAGIGAKRWIGVRAKSPASCRTRA